MPQAGQHWGSLTVLGFSVAVFLPSSTFGFSHEIMAPAVTATNIARRRVWKVSLYLIMGIIGYYLFDDNDIPKRAATM